MPIPGWFVLCEMPMIDVAQRVTCFHLIDNILAAPFKMPEDAPQAFREQHRESRGILPPLFAAVSWYGIQGDEGKTFRQKLSVRAPDGKEVFVENHTDFTMNTGFHRVIEALPPIGIRIPGVYSLGLHVGPVDGELEAIGAVLFNVVFATPKDDPGAENPAESAG